MKKTTIIMMGLWRLLSFSALSWDGGNVTSKNSKGCLCAAFVQFKR